MEPTISNLFASVGSLFMFVVVFSILPTLHDAHGMLCGPRQRAAWHEEQRCGFSVDPQINGENVVRDNCPHCLNGGTVATVKLNLPRTGWNPYNPLKESSSTRRAGLCGDPRSRVDHMIGGSFMPYTKVPITKVWKSGSEVDLTVEIDTNHNGYFEFHLCDLDACAAADIEEKCFQRNNCYRLERVPHDMCQDPEQNSEYECGPIDKKNPSRWYVPCRSTGHVGIHIVGGESGTMRYKLPDGVTCKHCVLQWYWATANSCNPPGLNDYFITYNNPFGMECPSDGGGRGAHNSVLETCGKEKIPEEFWSCADIQISADGNSLGSVVARGEPTPEPNYETNDEDRANDDPDGTIDEGQRELEEDINEENEKDTGEEQKEENEADRGLCLLSNSPCDATIPCCDTKQVCVYTIKDGMFTCRFWWALWQEVDDQEKFRASK